MLNAFKYFLKFYCRATTLYNVHSTFVYEFTDFVFHHTVPPDSWKKLTEVRKRLLRDQTLIPNLDLGAGSRSHQAKKSVSISRVASTAVSGPLKLKWLHNICAFLQPDLVLELGTSLGISAACIAPCADRVITIEGNPAIAGIAKGIFNELHLHNIELMIGHFDHVLPPILEKNKPGLVYIDGNHTYEATITYFRMLAEPGSNEDLVLVFDDIYWSADMLRAWEEIRNDPRSRLTIDLYHFGLVFFNTRIIAPKHYTLLPASWKPWHIGFRPVK